MPDRLDIPVKDMPVTDTPSNKTNVLYKILGRNASHGSSIEHSLWSNMFNVLLASSMGASSTLHMTSDIQDMYSTIEWTLEHRVGLKYRMENL